MSHLSRDERADRVAKDSGDPGEVVYSSTGYHNRSYHDKRDCYKIKGKKVRERKRTVAQGQHAPCRFCVLDDVDHSHEQGGISKLERAMRDDKETPEGFEGIAGGAD